MNDDMKKFLLKLLFMPVVVLCLFTFGIFFVSNQYQETYNASIIEKIARLKSINDPKIILVGNSNLALGMNSKMLQDAVNMSVVNLGLHDGLGNAFLENMAKFNINSGDLVIVCHSDFADDDITGSLLMWITLEYHTDLWPILRVQDYLRFITTYPEYWLKSFILWITLEGNKVSESDTYSRKSLNEFGDVVIRPENKRENIDKIFNLENQKVPDINDTCINRLNEYNKYIKSKGATLLIAGYPIGEGKFTPSAEEFDKFQHELESRLDCEIISNYRDYLIPYKYFYDTNLHLDEKGAKIRTQQLINDIQRWQAKLQNKTGNL